MTKLNCMYQLCTICHYCLFFSSRVNCSFYFKIGACRHGDRCSRLHNKPTFSQVRSDLFHFFSLSLSHNPNLFGLSIFDPSILKVTIPKLYDFCVADDCPPEHLQESSEQCPVCWRSHMWVLDPSVHLLCTSLVLMGSAGAYILHRGVKAGIRWSDHVYVFRL